MTYLPMVLTCKDTAWTGGMQVGPQRRTAAGKLRQFGSDCPLMRQSYDSPKAIGAVEETFKPSPLSLSKGIAAFDLPNRPWFPI